MKVTKNSVVIQAFTKLTGEDESRWVRLWFGHRTKGGGWFEVLTLEINNEGEAIRTSRLETVRGKDAARELMYAWMDEFTTLTGGTMVQFQGTGRFVPFKYYTIGDMEKSLFETALMAGLDKRKLLVAAETCLGIRWNPWERNAVGRFVYTISQTLAKNPKASRRYPEYPESALKDVVSCI